MTVDVRAEPSPSPTPESPQGSWFQRLVHPPERADLFIALALFVVCAGVFAACASSEVLSEHTKYNHFAHLADAWSRGHLDLPDGPPAYAQGNDFATYRGRSFVAFPPFPALILLPGVLLAGSPEELRDGLVFLLIAAAGPAVLFLALQRLSAVGHSFRSRRGNAFLAVCFSFGTVFFFSAEQGTVWFAAHVVSVLLASGYLWASANAAHPLLAGTCLALAMATRPPLAFALPLFTCEVLRVCSSSSVEFTFSGLRDWVCGLDGRRLATKLLLFGVPLLLVAAFTLWHNAARFDDPFDSGYQHLSIAWQSRIKKWGLFHYHYLAKNLGVVLTSLPWVGENGVPFRINVHGLALWFTTPLYLWLLWPKSRPALHWPLWLTVLFVALPTLFYQNTGWAQFGYRFSNDYAPFLFALLAIGRHRLGGFFALAAAWSISVNAFGALTFQRKDYRSYYYWQGSQERMYQKD